MVLMLSANGTNITKWWVDGSYSVHPNIRGYTGSIMSLGSESVYSSFTKQKLNTKSSTETELVAADDSMKQLIWTKYFLCEQEYGTKGCILFHDYTICIMLKMNGKHSSIKSTKNISIRFYFITDRIQKGDLVIEHYSTDDRVTDYFTKPLQGEKIRKFRKLIMNLQE